MILLARNLGQGQPVLPAAARVLRCLCRLRGDALCQTADPAFRRAHGHRQRHRLQFHLGRQPPAIPYCVNQDGFGPTWGNSLFEDSAEFTYGMFLGALQQRRKLADRAKEALAADTVPQEVKEALTGWLDNMQDAEVSGNTATGSKRFCRRTATIRC